MNRIGIIGFGNIAQRHINNSKNIFPTALVYGLSSSGRRPDNENLFCDHLVKNIEELIIINPDFVIVSSPSSHHELHALPLIEAGIPTFIEKPLASDPNSASRLAKASKKYNTPVTVGYCLRYHDSINLVKSSIEEGLLGNISNVFIEVGQFLPDWRPNKNYKNTVSANKNLGGGVLLELSHELDYFQWFFGKSSVEYASLRSSKTLGTDVEEIADIVLKTKSGIYANLHLDFIQRDPKRHFTVIGDKARLDWDIIKNEVSVHDKMGSNIIYKNNEWDTNDMYVNILKSFIKDIKLGSDTSSAIEESKDIIFLIDKIKNYCST